MSFNKKELRQEMIQQRKSLSPLEIKEKSLEIFHRLQGLSAYENARKLMTYVPFREEIHTTLLIRDFLAKNRQVFIPVTQPKEKKIIISELLDLEKDLETGHFGVMEPKPFAFRPKDPKIIDLVIVPGLAFTTSGYRIGYGGGYYDRFLPTLEQNPVTIALALDFQIVDSLPIDRYDVPVDMIVTESRVIDCQKHR
ncbi:5-formyltetrahydrofolate cyclo-ligase [Isachenkonia alkalipeptolytica]|uniref:5-formyltetrahydrofolate cyclo-ligase n=1 Tax=Isachenkonia alkalipeptolytica TaxID=2565777 RepID=A0AA43XIC3_9CLOT|nr:5-formyltetrahydrofolate cyclo-ligase [Isachenkonia alkalipeptolytica]NBG87353.1 5-formyltetrahydrofolate cyclo-ligase [Isachenkonia alkalipeptolytica]